MTRFVNEQAWVHRLRRCGWKYMPALELIRANSGREEQAVYDVEAATAFAVLREAEANLRAEMEKLLTPSGMALLEAAEQDSIRHVLEGS